MADVTPLPNCTSFDGAGRCIHSGVPCPFAGRFRECPDCTIALKVVMAPDEFRVVADADGRPRRGTLTVIECRQPRPQHMAAGVCVNAVLEHGAAGALLNATWVDERTVDFTCRHDAIEFRWQDGRFQPR